MSYGTRYSRHRGWWGYMKFIVRKYGFLHDTETRGMEKREMEAVDRAIEATMRLRDGRNRIELIELIFWRRSHNLAGAALKLGVSDRTALRWHGEFIKDVAREFFGDDAIDYEKKENKEEENENQSQA